MEKAPLLDLPFSDRIKIRGSSAINQPNCQVIIEDFPGDEFEWQFPHDEIQYCLSGSMQLTVWSPPSTPSAWTLSSNPARYITTP